MHCETQLGQRLWARDFDRQGAEIETRAAIPNSVTDFLHEALVGSSPGRWPGSSHAEMAITRAKDMYATGEAPDATALSEKR